MEIGLPLNALGCCLQFWRQFQDPLDLFRCFLERGFDFQGFGGEDEGDFGDLEEWLWLGEIQVGVYKFEDSMEFFEFGLEEGFGAGICQEVAEVGGGDLVVVEIHGLIIPHFGGKRK